MTDRHISDYQSSINIKSKRYNLAWMQSTSTWIFLGLSLFVCCCCLGLVCLFVLIRNGKYLGIRSFLFQRFCCKPVCRMTLCTSKGLWIFFKHNLMCLTQNSVPSCFLLYFSICQRKKDVQSIRLLIPKHFFTIACKEHKSQNMLVDYFASDVFWDIN